jgi:hypothetical protein
VSQEEDGADLSQEKDDADLGAVTRIYLKQIESALKSNGNERLKWADALNHIGILLSFSDDEGIKATGYRFARLASAFRDLELGRADPLFAPKKIDTRPPDASVVWGVRAEAAAAAQALIECFEITRKEALELISKSFPHLEHVAKPSVPLPRAIESWRNEFRKERVKSPGAHSHYLLRLKWLKGSADPDELWRRIHIVLQCAAEDARDLAE